MRRYWIGLLAASLIGTAGLASSSGPARAADPPTGFTDTSVAAINSATAVEWLPGDRIVALEQSGRVRVGRPGQAFATALTIGNVCSGGERGLLGLTPDPAFLGNGYVYVYYTRLAPEAPGGCVNRVSRFQMAGDVIDPASEAVLLDNISAVNTNHNGGDLDIGSDGYLYVSVGDAGRDPRGDSGSGGSNDAAQDLSLLNGKILRITLDGQPAPGNPIAGPGTARCAVRGNTSATPTSACQELFAWGLRNPYRIAFDRNDGSDRFFINDVGQITAEEVNEGLLGGNYGWPTREGTCPQGQIPPCSAAPAGVTDPITAYGRSYGTYITAGAFVPDGLWPAEYDGAYLFADGGTGRIWVRHADGTIDYDTPFATGAFGITDMTFGFDAEGRMVLYYVQVGGSLRAISPTAEPAGLPTGGLTFYPQNPERLYDTEAGIGVAAGRVVNGTTRLIQAADQGSGARAALVNVTAAGVTGPGFARIWHPLGERPGTSSLNVDRAGGVVANTAVVPVDSAGNFVLELTTSGRVIVDVMGTFRQLQTDNDNGRFIPVEPTRVTDTRDPSGDIDDPDADNVYVRDATDITIFPFGPNGAPTGEPAAAAVLSIGAIAENDLGGYVGAYRPELGYQGTSNVNVLPGDVRANMVVVPLEAGTGAVGLRTLNIDDVVVDLVGYFTDNGATPSSSGLFYFSEQDRVVDTRLPVGFGRLGANGSGAVTLEATRAAVVQNVAVTETAGPGWVATYPNSLPKVSTLNFTNTGQTRSVLAFTPLADDGSVRYASLVPTDLVVDVVGYFSE